MTNFIKGKLSRDNIHSMFGLSEKQNDPLMFSEKANRVFNTGCELWKYYHSQNTSKPDAGLYDIKLHFQGKNDKGRMNAKSSDDRYTQLINELRQDLASLAEKISEKAYTYGFLKSYHHIRK